MEEEFEIELSGEELLAMIASGEFGSEMAEFLDQLPDPVTNYAPLGFTVHLTLACTETCGHCVVAAAKGRRETIDRENMLNGLRDAAANGIRAVGFYGGEPFTRRDLLFEGVDEVYRLGMQPSIMTNGYWGKHRGQCDKIFDQIAEIQRKHADGKDVFECLPPLDLQVSTDQFHPEVTHDDLVQLVVYSLARRDCNVCVNLAGGSFEQDGYDAVDTIVQRAAEITKMPVYADRNRAIFFWEFDRLEVDLNGDREDFLRQLQERGFCSERFLSSARQPGVSIEQICAGIAHMGLPHIDCSMVEGQCIIQKGRQMGHKSYDIKLVGAGEQFLDDPEKRRIAAATRPGRSSIHQENEGNLILGLDNRFYVHPAQMHHRISPLGINTGNAIGRVIERVRAGDEIARILFQQDAEAVQDYAAASDQRKTFERVTELMDAGLHYEAIIEGLKDPIVRKFAENEAVLLEYGDFSYTPGKD